MKLQTTSWKLSEWTVERVSDDQVVLTRIKVPKLDINNAYTPYELRDWLHSSLESKVVRGLLKTEGLVIMNEGCCKDKSTRRIEIAGSCRHCFNLYTEEGCAQITIYQNPRKFKAGVEYFGWKGSKSLPKQIATMVTNLANEGE